MANFVGTWEKSAAENIEKFWEATGIPAEVREQLKDAKDIVIIENEADTWHITSKVKGMGDRATFKVGEPRESVTLLGKKMTGLIKSVGDTMEEEYVIEGVKSEVTRKTDNGKMIVECRASDIKATVWYDRK